MQAQIWDALNPIADTKARLGLENGDYMEEPATEGLIRSAVASEALDGGFAGKVFQIRNVAEPE
ncbi:hypothetical protein D3791_11650 [Glutamicibacter mishrai]|uniref:Uncharacterized protein n=1 Tax=Glutamicibacter mishrai TaxID=1775880 RepID=A0A6H0SK56_9MICC|nr:hypothetical protein D3791_11650 [Glutamicibacter mishrai]